MGVMDKFLNYMKLNEDDDDFYDDDYYDDVQVRKLPPCVRLRKPAMGWRYV